MKNFFKLSLRFNKKFSFEDLDLKIKDKKMEIIDIKISIFQTTDSEKIQ